MVFFGYGFCDTVFSAHDFGIRFFGYGFLGPRIGFLWCKKPYFSSGQPLPEKPSSKIPPPPPKQNRVPENPMPLVGPGKKPSPKSEGFSGFGFLGMVFVGWFFRASDFWVWFFGHGFLSYGYSYTDFFALRVCGEGFLDMAFGGGDTVLLGFC